MRRVKGALRILTRPAVSSKWQLIAVMLRLCSLSEYIINKAQVCVLSGAIFNKIIDIFCFVTGVAKSREQCVEWLRRAAALGHARALFNLALITARGEGAPGGARAAAELYKKAFDAGVTKVCRE